MKLSGKTKIKKQCLGLSLSHIQLSFPFFLPLCLFFLNEHWNKTVENGRSCGGPEGSPAASENKGRAEITASGGHSNHKQPSSQKAFAFSV